MDGNIQNAAMSNDWKVMSPSREYLGLSPKVRREIDQNLAEYPVRLGAIAKRLVSRFCFPRFRAEPLAR